MERKKEILFSTDMRQNTSLNLGRGSVIMTKKKDKKDKTKFNLPGLLKGKQHLEKREGLHIRLSRPDVHEEMKRERAEWLNSEVGYI